MARKIISHLCLVLTSVFLAVFSSLNSYAADISLNAVPIWSGIQPSFTCVYNGYSNTSNECVNTDNSLTKSISSIGFVLPAGINVTSGRTVMQIELLFDNYLDNNSIDGNFTRAVLNGNGFGLIDVSTSSQGATGYLVRLTFVAERTYTTASSDSYVIYNKFTSIELAYLKPGERMFISAIGMYNLQGDGSDAIVNAINNNNSTSAINDAKREIVSAIESQQQTQQDIYDDEKQTMQDDVDGASDTADTMDTSGFSLSNPWSGWLGLFSDSNCVSIPTLAGWIHSNETSICTPWQGHAAIRSYTTPVVSVLSLTLVFGLLVHWLKGDSDVGLENT